MKRILCYGASNTFGYDPRDPFGRPYPVVWTDYLYEYGFDTVNLGVPGKRIPHLKEQIESASALIDSFMPAEAAVVLLGANDILKGVTPKEAAERLRAFLEKCCMPACVVVAGEPVTDTGTDADENMREYNRLIEKMCGERGYRYADTECEDIRTAFDGIHLTEDSQRPFAAVIAQNLEFLEV